MLRHGYYFYVQGCVPSGKSPSTIDSNLLTKFDVVQSEWTRARRKELGLANLQYLRFGVHWIMLATHGKHHWFDEHQKEVLNPKTGKMEIKNLFRDVRELPIQIHGYSIYLKHGDFKKKSSPGEAPVRDDRWHARVLISRERYKELRAYFLDIACHRSVEGLAAELNALPYEPYKPVWRQLRKLVRLMNKKRKAAGYDSVPMAAVRWRRTIVKAFEPVSEQLAA